MSATVYPAFEAALAAGDTAAALLLYDAAMQQRNRAEDLVRGLEIALGVRAREKDAIERALVPAGEAIRKAETKPAAKSEKPVRAPLSTDDIPI